MIAEEERSQPRLTMADLCSSRGRWFCRFTCSRLGECAGPFCFRRQWSAYSLSRTSWRSVHRYFSAVRYDLRRVRSIDQSAKTAEGRQSMSTRTSLAPPVPELPVIDVERAQQHY